MRIHEVQDAAKALLMDAPSIAAFAPILVEDEDTDAETMAAAIDQSLDDRGVCIGIGDISGADRDQASHGRRILGSTPLSIYVFEKPRHDHTPARYALLDAIVTAMTSGEDEEFQFQSFDRSSNEKGGTCTVLDFTASVQLGT